jgi:hypothetical protein
MAIRESRNKIADRVSADEVWQRRALLRRAEVAQRKACAASVQRTAIDERSDSDVCEEMAARALREIWRASFRGDEAEALYWRKERSRWKQRAHDRRDEERRVAEKAR